MNEASGGTVSAAKGLAIWPEMRFEFPGKSAKAGMLGTGVGSNGGELIPDMLTPEAPGSTTDPDAHAEGAASGDAPASRSAQDNPASER
jgi:hypothetical protein